MRKFQTFQLWFIIPGIAILAASTLIPINYLYAQLYWTATEAIITGEELNTDGPEAKLMTLMDFTDHEGVVHHISEENDDDDSALFTIGAEDRSFRIYYDPLNPSDYMLANAGRYVIAIFLPFALFLCYLGWPHKIE